VDIVAWTTRRDERLAIRSEVFVHERGIREHEEHHGKDPECIHALAYADGSCVGTGRLLPTGRIGRMAVRAPYRGHGSGGKIWHTLMQQARVQGLDEVHLDAQVGAIAFYARHGFVAHGAVFQDAGIDHRRMSRRLGDP
jgi:predicted GNAT family N-acyltransferase